MPPKAKFTREEVVDAAFGLVKMGGVGALTARSLAAQLGSSARPVFTLFKGMDEVTDEVKKRAYALYDEYVERGLSSKIPFKGVGTQYILFAIEEPQLFRLLFMTESKNKPNIDNVLFYIEENYIKILDSIRNSYGLGDSDSVRLYRHLWIYTHGIATLCATGTCMFSAEQISEMLTDVCTSVITRIKSEGKDD